MSLYVVSKFFFHGTINGSLNMRASSLAFSFFLALFPSIIFLFTLIPYIPIVNFQDSLFKIMQTMLPKAAFEATEDTIIDIIKTPHGGLLSFGFISALYFSTNGFSAMIAAFNETFHKIETRTVLAQRLVSLGMVIISTVLVSISIALIVFTEIISEKLIHIDTIAYFFIHLAKYIILTALCMSFIAINYYLGPKERGKFRLISPGSLLSTILIILASLGFAYYVNHFGSYNKLYGSIGTLIVVMMWIYIISLILLIGFDLNVSIITASKNHKRMVKFTELV
jgi:membrane protein